MRKSRRPFALVEVLVSLALLILCIALLFGGAKSRSYQLLETKFVGEAERAYMLASSQLLEDLHFHRIGWAALPYSKDTPTKDYQISGMPNGWQALCTFSRIDVDDENAPTLLLVEAELKIDNATCRFKSILDKVNDKKNYRFCVKKKG